MAGKHLSAVALRPGVGLCVGKDCRKQSEFGKVRSTLEQQCDITELKCLGVCSGPVVVVEPDSSKPIVYRRMRTKRQRSLVLAASAGDMRARRELQGRRVTTKKTAERVGKQMKRRQQRTTRSRAA